MRLWFTRTDLIRVDADRAAAQGQYALLIRRERVASRGADAYAAGRPENIDVAAVLRLDQREGHDQPADRRGIGAAAAVIRIAETGRKQRADRVIGAAIFAVIGARRVAVIQSRPGSGRRGRPGRSADACAFPKVPGSSPRPLRATGRGCRR